MNLEDQLAKIHRKEFYGAFREMCAGRTRANHIEVSLHVPGVAGVAGALHALYMSDEVWHRAIKPALEKWVKDNPASNIVVSGVSS